MGIYNLFSRLGKATIVGLEPRSPTTGSGGLRIRSDFPLHTELPPAIAQRLALVAQRCAAKGAATQLLTVLVFDAGGDLYDVFLYGDFQRVAPAGANPGGSERQSCVRQVSTGLRVAWSPVERYRLYVAEVKL
jgi:hypothetical protein